MLLKHPQICVSHLSSTFFLLFWPWSSILLRDREFYSIKFIICFFLFFSLKIVHCTQKYRGKAAKKAIEEVKIPKNPLICPKKHL